VSQKLAMYETCRAVEELCHYVIIVNFRGSLSLYDTILVVMGGVASTNEPVDFDEQNEHPGEVAWLSSYSDLVRASLSEQSGTFGKHCQGFFLAATTFRMVRFKLLGFVLCFVSIRSIVASQYTNSQAA
jgi:hypothetical protein